MPASPATIILGSRSPRRLELLRMLVPRDRIRVRTPKSADEPDFQDLDNWPALERRLLDVARCKGDDVLSQIEAERRNPNEPPIAAVISADTVIVAGEPKDSEPHIPEISENSGDVSEEPAPETAVAQPERLVVLGQPPGDDSWSEVVRRWFRCYYFSRTHTAATAFCVATPAGERVEQVVKSRVTFHPEDDRMLEWYIRTGEPRGKAGGYALQGAGGVFVSRVEGSISNVVGLPLRELFSALDELGIDVDPSRD